MRHNEKCFNFVKPSRLKWHQSWMNILACSSNIYSTCFNLSKWVLIQIDPILKWSKIQQTAKIYWSGSYSSHARITGRKGLDWIGGGLDHQDALMLVIIGTPGGVWCYYFQHLIVTNLSFIPWNKAKTKLRHLALFLRWHDILLNKRCKI